MAPRSFQRMQVEEGVMSSHHLTVSPLTHLMLPQSGFSPRRARMEFPYHRMEVGFACARMWNHNKTRDLKLTVLNNL